MGDFKKLEVFNGGHALAINVIQASANMRGPVALAIKWQMVRAALSVPTNIVEGSAKGSDRDFARFIKISVGSLSELEYHLIVAKDTELLSQTLFESLFSQLVTERKKLVTFLHRLNASIASAASKADSRV